MKTTFRISGMHCASCAALITDALNDTPGVTRTAVDKEKGLATIEHDPAKASTQALRKVIETEGYGVRE